jgi:hypothetical protein
VNVGIARLATTAQVEVDIAQFAGLVGTETKIVKQHASLAKRVSIVQTPLLLFSAWIAQWANIIQ